MYFLDQNDPYDEEVRNPRMPQFFYETRVGSDLIQTEEPVQHVDEREAIAEAVKCLADMARDELPQGERELAVTVKNAEHTVIYEATLRLQVWP